VANAAGYLLMAWRLFVYSIGSDENQISSGFSTGGRLIAYALRELGSRGWRRLGKRHRDESVQF
jgi:hypothetical protein